MLVLDDIRFAYPKGPAYRFSMTAAPAEVTTIAGASGSGKSTLLDLIAGFQHPTGGTMALDGTDLLPLEPEQRPVSILFQSDALFEHLRAERNIALGLPSGTEKSAAREKVASALEAVGLAGIGPQRAATLSGGQKQRVALARTLLRDRPILLLDEPFSALDAASRQAARDLVATLTVRQNWHTVLVTHTIEDIEALANRRYRLKDGALVSG